MIRVSRTAHVHHTMIANPVSFTPNNTIAVEWTAWLTTKDDTTHDSNAVTVVDIRWGKTARVADYIGSVAEWQEAWGG